MSTLPDLPDFEDMYNTISEIKDLTFKKLSLDIQIKDEEAKITRQAIGNSEYFDSKGKPPTMSHIKHMWLHTGFKGELLIKRNKYATVLADLEYKKLKFNLDKALIDVWRTQSANARLAVS